MPTAGGAPRRVTTNPASDSGPVWSPDGTSLAFVSRRDADKAAQIYVIDVGGGEAVRLTEMPLGAVSVKWLPDGGRLVFVSHVIAGHESPEATAKALEAREKNKVKARVTENRVYRFWERWLTDEEFPHLFVVDVATKKVTDSLPGRGACSACRTAAATTTSRLTARPSCSPPRPHPTVRIAQLRSVQRPIAGGDVSNLTADNLPRIPVRCTAPTARASPTAAK